MHAKEKSKHIIIPCSGIGKALGTVTRTAAYIVTDELLPDSTETTCLPLLTIEDAGAIEKIRGSPCITIDGCVTQCAKKNVEYHKGKFKASIMILDVLRENPKLKPATVLEIGPQGEQLAEKAAEKIMKIIGGMD